MKKYYFVFVLNIFFGIQLYAQAFTGETGYMFLGQSELELSGNIDIKSGVIKKGEKIDIYAETGRKFTATILKITGKSSEVLSQVKPGEFGYFDLKFTENPSKGDDYLRNKYKVYPAGFKVNAASTTNTSNASSKKSDFISSLDGKTWKGSITYKGASFWKKGVKNLNEKPFLQLQFRSDQSPDSRLLTIQVFYPKESPAKYAVKDMEVNFSGSMDGKSDNTTIFGFVNGKGDTDFSLEITKWEPKGNKAIISGRINGKLKEVKILGRSKLFNLFEDGKFENIEVEVFSELYDLKSRN